MYNGSLYAQCTFLVFVIKLNFQGKYDTLKSNLINLCEPLRPSTALIYMNFLWNFVGPAIIIGLAIFAIRMVQNNLPVSQC